MSTRSFLGIFAHHDDESLGAGGLFAKYAAEGVRTSLITATRGQRGWTGTPDRYPGAEALGQIREKELDGAARRLGIDEVVVLDYMDGDLDQADPRLVIPEIAAHIRRIRPDVILTFDPFGAGLSGNTIFTISAFGAQSVRRRVELPSTLVGYFSFNPLKTGWRI